MSSRKHKIYLFAVCALLAGGFFIKNASAYKFEIFVIEMTPEGFMPQEIEIRQGQTVVFENLDAVNHWPELKLKNKNVISAGPLRGILPQDKWSYVFENTGLWELRDRGFSEFIGNILVKEDNGYTPGRPEEKPTANTQGKPPGFLKKIFQYFLTFFYSRKDTLANPSPEEIIKDETRLAAYIKKFGAGKAISEIEKITSSEECHRQTHLVGKLAYQIFKNNAFQWHAFAFNAVCNSGFFHGAMDELRNEGGSVEKICDNSPYSLKCAHDVGHSLMAAGDYKLYDVLKQCELLSKNKIDQEECFRGAFMENADGGINPEMGHSSKYLSGDPLYPCTEVPEKYKPACWQFTMGRFKLVYNENFEAMLAACARIPSPYGGMCFSSVGGVIATKYAENLSKIAELCKKGANIQGNDMCVMGAADELISNPKTRENALGFCDLLGGGIGKSNCQNAVLDSAVRYLGENLEKFCGSLAGEQKNFCLNFKKPNYTIMR